MANKHWEAAVLPPISHMFTAMSKDYPTSYSSPAPSTFPVSSDRKQYKQMSPNHWDMAIGGRLHWSAVYGTSQDYDQARGVAIHCLNLHLNAGLWTSEQFTGRPHGGYYLASILAQRAGARHKKDLELLSLQDIYFERLGTYLITSSTPTLSVWCCGERMPKGPVAQQQTAFLREIHGVPHRGELLGNDKTSPEEVLEEDAWVFLRGLRLLLSKGDTLGEIIRSITPSSISSLPLTTRRVSIERFSGGHLARYLDPLPPEKSKGVCNWVLVDYKESAKSNENRDDMYRGVEFGIEFKDEVPIDQVRGSSVRVITTHKQSRAKG